MTDRESRVVARLREGPATLADLRAALAADDPERRAQGSMGEEDPFGALISALVQEGAVVDLGGRYALPPDGDRAAP